MKNCPRVQKLWICLKVSLQTLLPKNSAEVDGGQMECHVCTDMGAISLKIDFLELQVAFLAIPDDTSLWK